VARSRFKGNGNKRDGTTFVALPYIVIDSPGYRAASHTARSLLLDIARQYTGHNNGKLVACAKYLRPLGWKSNNTVLLAVQQLLACGLLVETRKGGFPNTAAWFALSWCDLDQQTDLDINPRLFRRGAYLDAQPPTTATARTAKATEARRAVSAKGRAPSTGAALTPLHGAEDSRVAPSHGGTGRIAAPLDGAIPARLALVPTPLDGAYLEPPSPTAPAGGAADLPSLSPSLKAALARTAAGLTS